MLFLMQIPNLGIFLNEYQNIHNQLMYFFEIKH